jgi:membrane fusion protein
MQSAREPLHGRVTVVMPPSAPVAAAISLIALTMLGLAAFIVEVPQRTRAVGVLMPPDGFMKVVAAESGQVNAVYVDEGARVAKGQPLLSLTSDRGVIERGPVSASQLRSLENERRLMENANRERQQIQANRIHAIDAELASIDLTVAFMTNEIDIQNSRSALLQARFEGLQRLAADGNISSVQLDAEKLVLLQAEAAAASLKRQAAQIEHQREQVLQTRASLGEEAQVQQIEFAIGLEQIERRLAALEAAVSRHLLAPGDGVLARVAVRPGQLVHAGQTLMTLHHGDGALQAWLYLSSANAGRLYTGQEVELRLDAYPHQMFGTQAATIASISSIALLPSELDVPLALSGPVFEIRATLLEQHIRAHGRNWPLAAGTSFQADVVQQRYRLYEWLLRLRRAGDRRRANPVDA